MLRTIAVCEHNITVSPPQIQTLAAVTAAQVFANASGVKGPEIVARFIQNNTGADLYLSFGMNTCDAVHNYHVLLADQQVFDCYPHRLSVWAYSIVGGTVSAFQLFRNDLAV